MPGPDSKLPLRPLRMEDVARMAGVSLATVSRALRRPDSVSPDLRARVEQTAARLGYAPNPVAGSLAGTRSALIGVVVPSLTNSFFAATLECMATALEAGGYQLMIGHHDYASDREARIVAAFLSWNPAAMVVTGLEHSRQTVAALSAAACPVVEMWDYGPRPIDAMIGFRNAGAGEIAARHLACRGYKNVVFAGAIPDRDSRARARAEGFCKEFTALTGEHPKTFPLESRAAGQGAVALQRILSEAPATQAIAFSGDMLAAGALFEASRQGLRVPQDLAILGYGDLEIAAQTNPPLCTIRPPGPAIGEAVGAHVLSRLRDPGADGQSLELSPELVCRGSS